MPPTIFKSSPHTPTAINVHHSLINTFLPTTLKDNSEIIISVNSEQDMPNSNVSL